MTEAIAIPAEVQQETTAIVAWAKALIVNSPETYTEAGEGLKRTKGVLGRLAAFFTPLKRTQDAAKKAILDAEKKAMSGPEEAEQIIKRTMLTYQQEEQRKAQEKQRKLQAEVDAQAAKERAALEAKAAAAKKPETQQKHMEAAAQIVAPVVHVAPPETKAAGIATIKTWKFEIIDVNLIPKEYMVPDEKKIGGVVRAMKEGCVIPGVRVYFQESISSRSA